MSTRRKGAWGLGTRLLAAMIAVILVAAATAWAVAAATGQVIFHDHMLMAGAAEPEVVRHAEQAFDTAWMWSLSLALVAALLASIVVSVFLTRRIARTLARVRQAAARVASADYSARVPQVSMGAEFTDLAGAFNTMAGQLDRIEQTRRRLLGDLAHEMRTPVATLDGYLEAFVDGVERPDHATIGMLREQVGRLARLAEDITLVTTAEEGHLSMHRRTTTVAELIDNALSQAVGRYTDEGVTLETSATGGVRATMLTVDLDRLGQVLTNLLDNALRHTPPGGRVVLSARRDTGSLRLQITDTGSGIAAEHLPHLFERFYRADTARDRAHGGSGIGLAIASSITQAHGGTVTADSPGPGQGATFTIDLPIEPEPPQG